MAPVTQHGTTRYGGAFVASAVALVSLLPWLGPSSDPASGEAQRPRSSYGHTSAPDGTLRPSCHNYRYHYRVTTPTHDWTLETFLRDPTGDGLASGVFIAGTDPARDRAHFRFCRYSTRTGVFTIRGKVTWYDGDGNDHQVWLEPSHFRLRRP
jgi:hypothetical protein